MNSETDGQRGHGLFIAVPQQSAGRQRSVQARQSPLSQLVSRRCNARMRHCASPLTSFSPLRSSNSKRLIAATVSRERKPCRSRVTTSDPSPVCPARRRTPRRIPIPRPSPGHLHHLLSPALIRLNSDGPSIPMSPSSTSPRTPEPTQDQPRSERRDSEPADRDERPPSAAVRRPS